MSMIKKITKKQNQLCVCMHISYPREVYLELNQGKYEMQNVGN